MSQLDELLAGTAASGGRTIFDAPHTNIGAGLGAGWAGYRAGMGALANALGFDTADYVRKMQEEQQFYQRNAPGATEFFGEKGVAGEGKLSDWLAYNLGQSLPYMGEMLVGGLTGGAALGGRAAALVGTRAAAEQLARSGAKEFATAAAEKAALEEAAKQVGRRYAAAGAGGLASYPSAVGDILLNQQEAGGGYDLGMAALGGVPYAALNLLGGEAAALRAATGGLTREVGAEGAKNYLRRTLAGETLPGAVVRGGVKAGVEEGLAETGQEMINQSFGRMAVSPTEQMFSPDAMGRYAESFMAGLGLGGMMGGASQVFSKPTTASPDDIAKRADQLERSMTQIRAGIDTDLATQEKDAAYAKKAEEDFAKLQSTRDDLRAKLEISRIASDLFNEPNAVTSAVDELMPSPPPRPVQGSGDVLAELAANGWDQIDEAQWLRDQGFAASQGGAQDLASLYGQAGFVPDVGATSFAPSLRQSFGQLNPAYLAQQGAFDAAKKAYDAHTEALANLRLLANSDPPARRRVMEAAKAAEASTRKTLNQALDAISMYDRMANPTGVAAADYIAQLGLLTGNLPEPVATRPSLELTPSPAANPITDLPLFSLGNLQALSQQVADAAAAEREAEPVLNRRKQPVIHNAMQQALIDTLKPMQEDAAWQQFLKDKEAERQAQIDAAYAQRGEVKRGFVSVQSDMFGYGDMTGEEIAAAKRDQARAIAEEKAKEAADAPNLANVNDFLSEGLRINAEWQKARKDNDTQKLAQLEKEAEAIYEQAAVGFGKTADNTQVAPMFRFREGDKAPTVTPAGRAASGNMFKQPKTRPTSAKTAKAQPATEEKAPEQAPAAAAEPATTTQVKETGDGLQEARQAPAEEVGIAALGRTMRRRKGKPEPVTTPEPETTNVEPTENAAAGENAPRTEDAQDAEGQAAEGENATNAPDAEAAQAEVESEVPARAYGATKVAYDNDVDTDITATARDALKDLDKRIKAYDELIDAIKKCGG